MDLVFLILIMFVFVYLLLIRPQRQQQRRHAEMLDNLKVGDEVITAGGIYGDVTEVQSDRVSLEIAEDVEIEVAKRAIASVVPPEEQTADEPEDAEEPGATAETETPPVEEPEPVPEARLSEEDTARR
jgi:preprotein translocase subunit YajC